MLVGGYTQGTREPAQCRDNLASQVRKQLGSNQYQELRNIMIKQSEIYENQKYELHRLYSMQQSKTALLFQQEQVTSNESNKAQEDNTSNNAHSPETECKSKLRHDMQYMNHLPKVIRAGIDIEGQEKKNVNELYNVPSRKQTTRPTVIPYIQSQIQQQPCSQTASKVRGFKPTQRQSIKPAGKHLKDSPKCQQSSKQDEMDSGGTVQQMQQVPLRCAINDFHKKWIEKNINKTQPGPFALDSMQTGEKLVNSSGNSSGQNFLSGNKDDLPQDTTNLLSLLGSHFSQIPVGSSTIQMNGSDFARAVSLSTPYSALSNLAAKNSAHHSHPPKSANLTQPIPASTPPPNLGKSSNIQLSKPQALAYQTDMHAQAFTSNDQRAGGNAEEPHSAGSSRNSLDNFIGGDKQKRGGQKHGRERIKGKRRNQGHTLTSPKKATRSPLKVPRSPRPRSPRQGSGRGPVESFKRPRGASGAAVVNICQESHVMAHGTSTHEQTTTQVTLGGDSGPDEVCVNVHEVCVNIDGGAECDGRAAVGQRAKGGTDIGLSCGSNQVTGTNKSSGDFRSSGGQMTPTMVSDNVDQGTGDCTKRQRREEAGSSGFGQEHSVVYGSELNKEVGGQGDGVKEGRSGAASVANQSSAGDGSNETKEGASVSNLSGGKQTGSNLGVSPWCTVKQQQTWVKFSNELAVQSGMPETGVNIPSPNEAGVCGQGPGNEDTKRTGAGSSRRTLGALSVVSSGEASVQQAVQQIDDTELAAVGSLMLMSRSGGSSGKKA